MPLSLLTILAARHGDTLKNAFKGDADARRLLLALGLHPDDLDALVRRRADPSTQGSAWLTLLDERDRAKSMVREILHLLGPGVEDARLGIAHLKAQADHLLARHREVRNALGVDVGGDAVAAVQALKAELEEALYDRRWVARALRVDHREHGHLGGLVETQCELHADLSRRMEQIRVLLGIGGSDDVQDAIRTQAAFEQQLAEADEHVRVLEGRLVREEEDGARLLERFDEIADLLGIEEEGCNDVPDAIRRLRKRAASVEASVQELRQCLQAEIMAHGTTRMFAESAEAATKHDTIADLLALPDYVRIEVWPVGDSFNARAVRQADGAVNAVSNTPREALIALYNHITERVKPEAAKPPEPIVLGPWRNENGVMRREKLAGPWKGYAFMHAYPATPNGAWSCILPDAAHAADREHTDIGGAPAADKWARENGYVLLDAEPGSLKGTLTQRDGPRLPYWVAPQVALMGVDDGWWIHAAPPGRPYSERQEVAAGPQTGEEGKRCALVAAHALGLTGGGE